MVWYVRQVSVLEQMKKWRSLLREGQSSAVQRSRHRTVENTGIPLGVTALIWILFGWGQAATSISHMAVEERGGKV